MKYNGLKLNNNAKTRGVCIAPDFSIHSEI